MCHHAEPSYSLLGLTLWIRFSSCILQKKVGQDSASRILTHACPFPLRSHFCFYRDVTGHTASTRNFFSLELPLGHHQGYLLGRTTFTRTLVLGSCICLRAVALFPASGFLGNNRPAKPLAEPSREGSARRAQMETDLGVEGGNQK